MVRASPSPFVSFLVVLQTVVPIPEGKEPPTPTPSPKWFPIVISAYDEQLS